MFNNFNNDALMAAAAQMLQASGPSRTPTGLGQILGGGMQTYMGAAQAAKQRELEEQQAKQMAEMRAMQMQEMQSTLTDRTRQREAAERIAQIKAKFGGGAAPAPAPAEIALGSTPMNSSMGQPMPQQAAPQNEYQQRMAMVAHLRANGAPDEADAMAKEALQFMPKVKEFEKVRVGGKVLFAPLFDNGSMGEPLEREVAEKLEFRDAGGSVVGLDSYSGAVKTTLGKTATIADGLAQRRFNLEREKFGYQKQQDVAGGGLGAGQGKAPSGYRWKADGSLEPIPGGPAGVKAAPTEFQGKSAAFGLRAAEADKTITALGDKYSPAKINAKQAVGNAWVIGGALEAATNMTLSDNDQKAEQAQRDFVNAVLRQESGAAIGADEFTNAKRQYFPQPGDGAAVIAQKARNRQLAIQGFNNNAGRAAIKSPAASAGGWSIKRKD